MDIALPFIHPQFIARMLKGHSQLLQLQTITICLSESAYDQDNDWLEIEDLITALASRQLPSLRELNIDCGGIEHGGPSLMEQLRDKYTRVHTSLVARYREGQSPLSVKLECFDVTPLNLHFTIALRVEIDNDKGHPSALVFTIHPHRVTWAASLSVL